MCIHTPLDTAASVHLNKWETDLQMGAGDLFMTRGRKSTVLTKKNETDKETEFKTCTADCGKKLAFSAYYVSNSPYDKDGRMNVCKACLKKDLDSSNLDSVKTVLLAMNRPYLSATWVSAVEEGKRRNNTDPFGWYIKQLQFNYKDLTWKDSDESNINKNLVSPLKEKVISEVQVLSEMPTPDKNKEDVLRMLGYDPFEFEVAADKRHLFNKLVDFLDESTLEDSFKLPAVIEIVKTFNQIDKINSALSLLASDTKTVTNNVGGIKSLIDAKEKMLKSVLALAKDNGISVNHNNNKSKGAGTLSGIIKQLQEKGIGTSEINIYNVETCEGMRQVANISNRSIMEQLMLNENDYTEMIKDQRDMILNLTEKTESLEEENRLLKVRLKFSEIEERKAAKYVEGEILGNNY
jgi:hypothetical protein